MQVAARLAAPAGEGTAARFRRERERVRVSEGVEGGREGRGAGRRQIRPEKLDWKLYPRLPPLCYNQHLHLHSNFTDYTNGNGCWMLVLVAKISAAWPPW